ncbi:hypothetical protein SARC_09818 [Sphaeroforma arctica JP610]|uniref:Uncharacterized protein n=1 Tax=Sphaeroforma arctica JP610 TaxID=667725 RepID=A0A0L0FLS5_9EUKA|nr:hypothetical protein SARC_09818 [Sphaeroforma arctica JP610]KNC77729.1 hypothetical protein SARC_09818 [Sphaeroforma arctica JP610]|eukprot:XP_014151631.1 hypothetical protein SARC_09818 [Sphaeroforma arctica JP610]
MPVENFGGMALGGDVETDHAQMGKAGLGAIVKRRKKAKRAEDLKDQGIIISNYMALGGWEWALYVVALRSVYLVNENTIIQQVASLCVVAPILSITYRYFRTWLCMSMDVVALVCATQARARVLMVYCLVLLVFHIITVMIIQVKRAALFPVVITLAMAAAGALIHALQTNESDEELGDLYEEALILDTLEYINSIFDKFAHS